MYAFTRKCGAAKVQFVMFTDCKKHGSAGALIHRQQTIYWIFTQTKPSRVYRRKLIVTYWALIKYQTLLTIQAKLKLAIIFSFFYCLVEIDSSEILASVWQEEGNFEVLKRCYIQIYPISFLLCFGKAVNLQHMWNLEWSNVELLWKKQRNTTWSVIS